jgi:hypothetical protein
MEEWSRCKNADFMIAATVSQATTATGLKICDFLAIALPPPARAVDVQFGSPEVF